MTNKNVVIYLLRTIATSFLMSNNTINYKSWVMLDACPYEGQKFWIVGGSEPSKWGYPERFITRKENRIHVLINSLYLTNKLYLAFIRLKTLTALLTLHLCLHVLTNLLWSRLKDHVFVKTVLRVGLMCSNEQGLLFLEQHNNKETWINKGGQKRLFKGKDCLE